MHVSNWPLILIFVDSYWEKLWNQRLSSSFRKWSPVVRVSIDLLYKNASGFYQPLSFLAWLFWVKCQQCIKLYGFFILVWKLFFLPMANVHFLDLCIPCVVQHIYLSWSIVLILWPLLSFIAYNALSATGLSLQLMQGGVASDCDGSTQLLI